MDSPDNIRNFAIIAHVDHGKSTLADRFLEITGVVKKGGHEEQMLDRNPISRERGITIKLAPVRMNYSLDVIPYSLNLIDTPGHVDFSYEVERTLACVEGVILLVDATAGIQAQTIAHTYKALEQNLVIIPAVNKIDMPSAQIKQTKNEISEFLGVDQSKIFEISAKQGQGVEKLLEEVIRTVPPPTYTPEVSVVSVGVRALIFDSYFDPYRGVIAFIRVFDGIIKKEMNLNFAVSKANFEAQEVGIFTPDLKPTDSLRPGEIGYVITNLKDIHQVSVGDTISDQKYTTPLSGYKKVKPMVYASIFSTDPDEFPLLKKNIEKLMLSDASLEKEPIYSQALGSGFRIGFLGLLHADVVRERLEREFGLSLILTPPTVRYEIHKTGTKKIFSEPIAQVDIITPQKYSASIMRLCQEARGKFLTMDNKSHIYMSYEIPMSDLIVDFFDNLKSITSGFASFDWQFKKYQEADIDKLDILLNDEPVEEFSDYVVADKAMVKSRSLVDRLKELIPRQQFEVRIQAKYKGKIIASSRIAPFRKDVTQKLYGGDRSRKDKLLKKQKKGKKMMKNVGRVEIPKEAFFKLFRR